MRAAVITISDSGSEGRREDLSGPVLESFVAGMGGEVAMKVIVPDEPGRIRDAFREAAGLVGRGLILSTGGTGLSPRDNTPEAVAPLMESFFPGVMEALRRDGRAATPMASLSRGLAGRVGQALAVTLPGSARAVTEACRVLGPLVRAMREEGLLERD